VDIIGRDQQTLYEQNVWRSGYGVLGMVVGDIPSHRRETVFCAYDALISVIKCYVYNDTGTDGLILPIILSCVCMWL
jgi:hypothetical protein